MLELSLAEGIKVLNQVLSTVLRLCNTPGVDIKEALDNGIKPSKRVQECVVDSLESLGFCMPFLAKMVALSP